MSTDSQLQDIRQQIRTACMVNIGREVNARVCSISQKQTDEILRLCEAAALAALPEDAPFECPNVEGSGNCNQKDCPACSSWMRHSSEGADGHNQAIATAQANFHSVFGGSK